MKAMVLEDFGRSLVLKEVEMPKMGPNDALIKVKACGVCRTDVKIRSGQVGRPLVNPPAIPGHEPAGEVVAVGEQVSEIRPGDRVVVYMYVPCRDCPACNRGQENLCLKLKRVGFDLQGAFAEYLVVPAYQLIKLSDNISFEQAGVLTDAVVVPYHAIREQAKVRFGDTVMIVGIGGLGIHAIQVAKLAGARIIAVDVSEEKLQLASELGAHHVVNSRQVDAAAEVGRITEGYGVDAVIENVGAPETLAWTLPAMRKGGKLVIVGYVPGRPFPVDSMAMHYNEWEIIGSRLATKQELAEVVTLVGRGDIRPWVTKTYTLEQANEALDDLAEDAIVGRATLVL